MGLTRKGIVDQKPQFIPTLSLIIQNNSKVMFNTHVILFQYMTKAFCFNQWQEHKSIKISLNIAYSDKMLFLDLGPGTSDLGSLI